MTTITQPDIQDASVRYSFLNWLPAVEVRYLRPTERRGSCIRFTPNDGRKSFTLPFRYDIDYHAYAALIAEKILGSPVRCISLSDRYVFVPEQAAPSSEPER